MPAIFTNPDNETDGGVLELDGATFVTSADVGGVTYVFVAGAADHGISVFALGLDGTLTNVANVTDGLSLNLLGVSGLTTLTVNGNTYLVAAGASDNGLSVFRVGVDGSLTNVDNPIDGGALNLGGVARVASATVGGNTYVFAAGSNDDGISVFRMAGNGRLTAVVNFSDTAGLELDGVKGLTTAVIGGNTFLFAAGGVDDGVSVFQVSAAGVLTHTGSVTDNGTLRLDGASDVITAVVGGVTYLFVTGTADNGVSVFSVSSSGVLTNTANVGDSAGLRLGGAAGLTVSTFGTTTWLTVGGQENGVSVFRVNAAGTLTAIDNIDDGGARELSGAAMLHTATVGGTSYILGVGNVDDGVSVFGLRPSGQLWFTTEGGDGDTRIVRINNDGSGQTVNIDNSPVTDPLPSSFMADVGLDTAAGFYFGLSNSGTFGDNAFLVRGVIGSSATPTIVIDFPDSVLVNNIQVDAINERIYVGYQDGSGTAPTNTGIRVYSYNPLNGAVSDLGFLTTAAIDNRGLESGFDVLDPRDFALDSSIGRLFYTELLAGGAASVGLFRLDLASPNVATQLVSQTQFPDNGSNGYIYDVEVDQTTDLVYFSTQSQSPSPDGGYNAAHNAIWYISENATSGTAVKVTLVGAVGATFYPGDMTFDQNLRQLYVESEEGGASSADDVIYVFQLDGTGTTATLINSFFPNPAFVGSGANIQGMVFSQLPTLSGLTGTAVQMAEQPGTGTVLLTGAPTITDFDGDHLAGATVQITGGRFSSNETSNADDHLAYGAALQISGLISGTNITVSWNSATETLSLTGYDTITTYRAVLAGLRFYSTGDNPTNYGLNPTRTITWTVNDGTPDIPGGAINSGTTTLTIAAVNDAPVNGSVASATGNEDTLIGITGLQISDADANPALQTMTVTLSVTKGVLNLLTGVTGGLTVGQITGNGSGSVTLSGTLNEINATLAAVGGLVFDSNGNVNGTDTLTVVTNDGGGTGSGGAKSDTDAYTITITPLNDPHTGGASISGTPTEDQVLTAISNMTDPDGLGTLHYQWQRDVGSGYFNVGVDQSTYTLGDADAGGTVRVVISYTDGGGVVESSTSPSTPAIASVNDAPTGGVSVSGVRIENQVLTANTSTLADADGLGTLHYQWQRNTGAGFVNVGVDQATYTLGDPDVGGTIRVVVSYVDQQGTAESVTSAATIPISNVNDPHTGGASIMGTANENQVLTAVSNMTDADGLGTLHYQWQHDVGSGFVNIGTDQSTYTIGDGDVGGLIRVVISYTDGHGSAEFATSSSTAAISGVNDPHTGGASITGTPTENQVLTAVSTMADADGLGTLHYQWQRNVGSGFFNVGADQSTYTLGDADVGGVVRVVVSYIDQQGFSESATSASSAAIANVNDAPTGGVSMTGTTTENQVLTANTSTLADVDGLGTLHYQWQRNVGSGFFNVGADQATYTLGDADVGGVVRVIVSYVDQQGTSEAITSASSAAIAGVNDPHTGGASITGTATEDQILTATSTLADVDGMGTLHYQWQRDTGSGFVNVGADQSTYTLGDADVGGVVRVVVSYIDQQGFSESATSASTAAIANVPDVPLAFNDAVSVNESALLSGSVFVNNGSGADSDPDGPALSVSAVNGSGGAVGNQITLPSGALLTLNANGTFAYNPNGQFNFLPGAASGASNQTYTDTFTYTLSGGGSATVTVTVQGQDSNGDFLLGTAGADTLSGGIGDDSIDGGLGNDLIDGGDGYDTIFGGEGDDTIYGGDGTEEDVHGDDGADILYSGGEGHYFGDAGDDLIYAGLSGSPAEVLDGGLGVDTLDTRTWHGAYTINLTTGATDYGETFLGFENLITGNGADTITGTSAANVIRTTGGNDTIDGLGGADVLSGGGGVDVLNGGDGFDTADYSGAAAAVTARLDSMTSSIDGDGGTDAFTSIEALTGSAFNDTLIGGGLGDTLRGGLGSDTLLGQGGNDVLWGGSGAANTLQGGLGDDTYVLEAADSIVESAGQGTDTVDSRLAVHNLAANIENLIFGGVGNFTGSGNALNNTLTGGAGDDVLRGRGGVDIIQGGSGGMDTADYSLAAAGVHARLDTMSAINDGDGATDTFVGIDAIVGSAFVDLLVGGTLGDRLSGGFGADTLLGQGGNDILAGGQGAANQLQGGAGDDLYILDAYDTVVEGAGAGIDTIEAHVGVHTMGSNVENMYYVGANKFDGSGNVLNNVITGGIGNDILKGLGGNDTLIGGQGLDEVQLRGSQAQYTITAEGAGWRVVDSVGGRDGSTLVQSIETLRFLTGNTTTTLAYPPPPPSPLEPTAKGGDEAQVLPSISDDDPFVLPAVVDDQPLVLPGVEALKDLDEPLVLPGAEEGSRLFPGLEPHLPPTDDRSLTLDTDGHLPGYRENGWI